VFALLAASVAAAQAPPAAPLTLVTREGRRPLPTTVLNGQELIALDDVASVFGATLREEALAGGVTLTYRGRTIVASANQATVSAGGRVVALPSPVVRSGRRWMVPVEFLQSALGVIHDQRIVVRRPSRLVLFGEVRVPRVTGRVDSAGPPTRATLDVSPAAPIRADVEAGRVTVRIDADALDLALPGSGAGLVAQMRPGDEPNTVIVTLASNAGTVRAVPQTTDTSSRLVIDIQPAGVSAAPVPDPAAPPLGAPPEPSLAPAAGVSAETLLAPRPVLQTIVIDPGHGGEERGARGAAGAVEKQITLDVARRLRTLLEARLGVRVILTRESDVAIGPGARAALANNNKADLFLSLHANGAPVSSVAGAEVYYLKLDREGETARERATRSAVAVPVLGGGTRTIDVVPWELAQAAHVDDSATLAATIADELRSRISMSPSPTRAAPLRVLEGLNMPAALVEMGYLTNPAQEKLVASENYRNAVAQSLHDAIVRFRTHLEDRRSR
jgi:N-acetylmuramoyl-L-alanine amidase